MYLKVGVIYVELSNIHIINRAKVGYEKKRLYPQRNELQIVLLRYLQKRFFKKVLYTPSNI